MTRFVEIDGGEYWFKEGETILAITKRNGIFIPTLCNLKDTIPTGACRLCLVEIKGARTLSPSCCMPALDEMVIQTASPKVIEARKMIIALLLQPGHHNCSVSGKDPDKWTGFQKEVKTKHENEEVCPVYGECSLQKYAYKYQVETKGLVRREVDYETEMASPLIIRDFSRCILCGRCVSACNEIQVNNAISHGFRGIKAKIVTRGDSELSRSECVFCGECIQACPVGALVEKKNYSKVKPWETQNIRTTCGYCGVGCQLLLHVKDNTIMKVTGAANIEPNKGKLCFRGRFGYDFVHSEKRLTHPMVRKNGILTKVSWEEALNTIVRKIHNIHSKHGSDSIAAIGSSSQSSEALYLMQKFFRCILKTNNISSPNGGKSVNEKISDFEKADRILIIGSDITKENPVAGTYVKRAVLNGKKLTVIHSKKTEIGNFATWNILVKDGTEAVLINSILSMFSDDANEKSIYSDNNIDAENACRITGLTLETLSIIFDFLDTEESVKIIYGPKVARFGKILKDLCDLLSNKWNKKIGLNYMGELSNSFGACLMGMVPNMLPGFLDLNEDVNIKKYNKIWNAELSEVPGLSFHEVYNNISDNSGVSTNESKNRIRLLYLLSVDPVLSGEIKEDIFKNPDSLEFLIVQDSFESKVLQYADVVLPVTTWAEEDGTCINSAGRVSRLRKAVDYSENVRTGINVFSELARKFAHDWTNSNAEDLWDKEIVKNIPQLCDISYRSIEKQGIRIKISDAVIHSKIPAENYHHYKLLEMCEGLNEPLPGTAKTYSELTETHEETVKNFENFLKEENISGEKSSIDKILQSFLNTKGGLIPVLQEVQEIVGFLPVRVQNYIALKLRLPPSSVYGVVTFYSFFTMVPRGKHIIRVCLGTACFVNGSAILLEILEKKLGIGIGETSKDREFSLDVVRCVGACGLAPVVIVDDETYGEMNAEKLLTILQNIYAEGCL
jgi:predicted molibdopterin-dependent oxidoreductase YjgC/NADH:ubiquinone oxidoreductase subunit E